MNIKDEFTNYIHNLQDRICQALEEEDGKAQFEEDLWDRPGGGGGRTRVIRNGAVFEKGGVNISVVHGELPKAMQEKFGVDAHNFFACGLSLVIHPKNPKVPTTHANFRYFEMYDFEGKKKDAWFGGGIDLTPYYVFEEDCINFHKTIKSACDLHDTAHYPRFKKECDEYFFNSHRNEARGIGGVFFDYLKGDASKTEEEWMKFTKEVGDSFIPSYVPIVAKRKTTPYNESNKEWQEIRRGRYVEFNLIHDRGTLFGLKTGGRTESILMSLPATVRWEYDHHPEEGSEEAKLLEALKPKDWANLELTT